MERFAVTTCNDYLYELGVVLKRTVGLTRHFDQFALIVFWRMLDYDAACC